MSSLPNRQGTSLTARHTRTPCKLFTRRIPHPSHSIPCLKGSPGPSALVTCPSCRKSTHSSSRHHKTPRVLMILFPHQPHHQQPARQTQWLLALSPTFAAGQPGMLGAAQKKKKKKLKNIKPVITQIINSFGQRLLPPCSPAALHHGLPHLAGITVTERPQGWLFSPGSHRCIARSP